MLYSRKTYFLIGLLVVSLAFLYLFFFRAPESEQSIPYAAETLNRRSMDYAEGRKLIGLGEDRAALEALRKAGDDAKNPAEAGQVQFHIGVAMNRSGDPLGAIRHLKAMGDDPKYTKEARAYAIQYLGEIYYRHPTPEVIQVLFESEPYKSFYREENIDLALRQIFEYSSSIKPTAMGELRLAESSVDEIRLAILPTKEKNSLFQVHYIEHLREIRRHAALAEAAINRVEEKPFNEQSLPVILSRKAALMIKMYEIGEKELGDPEPVLKQALDVSKKAGINPDGFILYYYALYLGENFARERTTEIHDFLKVFYESETYKNSTAERFFAREKTNLMNHKSRLQLLANIDPSFKDYLRSLGWADGDFSETPPIIPVL